MYVRYCWSGGLRPGIGNTNFAASVLWRFRDRDPDDNLLEQLQDAGARLRERGRERDDARQERDAARAEVATLRRERDEALRERDAARKQLAARNDMLAQVLKEQQY